ncbi:hypothetical protein NDQ86_03185 [Salinispora arenicola]|nr:hypothetical protein [Salinispora arenicola]
MPYVVPPGGRSQEVIPHTPGGRQTAAGDRTGSPLPPRSSLALTAVPILLGAGHTGPAIVTPAAARPNVWSAVSIEGVGVNQRKRGGAPLACRM